MVFDCAGRFGQPPVQVKLVLHFAGLGIDPGPTRAHDDGGGTQQCLQYAPCLLRLPITFNGKSQAISQVLLPRPPAFRRIIVPEGRDRRAEHDRHGRIRGLAYFATGRIDQPCVIMGQRDWRDAEHLIAALVV